MLEQDALHFLDRFWITLHRVWLIYNLLRCAPFVGRALILDAAVSALCRRPTAYTATLGVGDDSIRDGDRG